MDVKHRPDEQLARLAERPLAVSRWRLVLDEHRRRWSDQKFRRPAILATLFFFFSLFINELASDYATSRQSNHVSDVILDALPVVNVIPVITVGTIFLLVSVPVIVAFDPKYIPFTGMTMGLFILIRAVFICLTHTAVPEGSIGQDGTFFRLMGLAYTGDLFFSGHTGGPFMLSLVFRDHVRLRVMYLVTSAVLGSLMLLAHAHYSIDVLAAPFISFSIFHLSMWLFPGAYKMARDVPLEPITIVFQTQDRADS